MPWFVHNSGAASVSTNYTLVGTEPTCSGTDRICAIFAVADNANFPILSDGVQSAMIDALNTSTSIPGSVLLKD